MRIAYLTLDEVNENLATLMAEECGATLFPLTPRDPKPDGEFDAVLFDLDSLPPRHQKELLSDLLSSSPLHRVGVHSYQLEEEAAAALRRPSCYLRTLARPLNKTTGYHSRPLPVK